MNLIDEEHVALCELGQKCSKIAGPLYRGTRRDVEDNIELVRDDPGERGLAEPRWSRKKKMIGSLASALGCLEHDVQALLELSLSDKVSEASRPKTRFSLFISLFIVVKAWRRRWGRGHCHRRHPNRRPEIRGDQTPRRRSPRTQSLQSVSDQLCDVALVWHLREHGTNLVAAVTKTDKCFANVSLH